MESFLRQFQQYNPMAFASQEAAAQLDEYNLYTDFIEDEIKVMTAIERCRRKRGRQNAVYIEYIEAIPIDCDASQDIIDLQYIPMLHRIKLKGHCYNLGNLLRWLARDTLESRSEGEGLQSFFERSVQLRDVSTNLQFTPEELDFILDTVSYRISLIKYLILL